MTALEIVQIVGIGLITTVLAMILKEQKPIFAFLLALFAGMVIFLFLIGKIAAVIQVLEEMAAQSGVDMIFFRTILKIIGIAYIAEFGAQIVRDAGQDSVAAKIELAGKVLILFMAIPIITVIMETVMKLMPG